MVFSSHDIVTHKNYPKDRFFRVLGTSGNICYCVAYPSNNSISEYQLLNFSGDLLNLVTYSPTLEILKLFINYV